MRVLVISHAGAVGKTTVAREVLAPRMRAPVLAVGERGEGATGAADFSELYDRLLTAENAIVDVCGAATEEFLSQMTQFHRAQNLFDRCLVPVVSGTKPQRDAIRTIDALANLGIPAAGIYTVFNRIKGDGSDDFDLIFERNERAMDFVAREGAFFFESDVFEVLRPFNLSVSQMAADMTDFTAQRHDAYRAKDDDQASRSLWLSVAHRLASSMEVRFDATYKELFP